MDAPFDYIRLLDELKGLCPKGLTYDSTSCVRQGRQRLLNITRRGRTATFALDDRGVIDRAFVSTGAALSWLRRRVSNPRPGG